MANDSGNAMNCDRGTKETAQTAVANGTSEPAGNATERRRRQRFDCDGTAEIYLPHTGVHIAGRITNLSGDGCFIDAPSANLERGTQIEVLFEANHLNFRICGNITALQPRRGVGIGFLHPSERIMRQIDALLAELETVPHVHDCQCAAEKQDLRT